MRAASFAEQSDWRNDLGFEQRLARLRSLANFLDTAIMLPNGFRFGADSLIGLVPGIGDTMTTIIACYFVAEAYKLGLPRKALLKMAANVAVNAVGGSLPIVGDLLDTVYKANIRNLGIIEDHVGKK